MLRYTSSSTISPQWTTFRQSNVQRSLQLPPESTLEAIPCSLLHFHELCATSVDISPPQPTRTFVITIRIAASKFGRSTFSIGRMRSCRRQIGSRGRGRGRSPLASTRHLRSFWSLISEWVLLVYTCAVIRRKGRNNGSRAWTKSHLRVSCKGWLYY